MWPFLSYILITFDPIIISFCCWLYSCSKYIIKLYIESIRCIDNSSFYKCNHIIGSIMIIDCCINSWNSSYSWKWYSNPLYSNQKFGMEPWWSQPSNYRDLQSWWWRPLALHALSQIWHVFLHRLSFPSRNSKLCNLYHLWNYSEGLF